MTPPTSPGVDPPARGADGFYHPASEEELIALVVMAAREVRQCRVRGSAHSVSHAIYTDPLEKIPNRVNQQSPPPGDGVDIMLDCYQQLTVIDSKEKLVQAQAGIHLGPDPRLGGPTDAVRIASEQSSLLGQLWAQRLDARQPRRHHPPDRQRVHGHGLLGRLGAALDQREHLGLHGDRCPQGPSTR